MKDQIFYLHLIRHFVTPSPTGEGLPILCSDGTEIEPLFFGTPGRSYPTVGAESVRRRKVFRI